MSTLIPSLSALVLVCAAFPTQLIRVASMTMTGASARQRALVEQWGMPVLAAGVAALAWYVAPLPDESLLPQWSLWLVIAVAVGAVGPAWEIGLGYAVALVRRRRVDRVALHGSAPQRTIAVVSVCIVAVAEEVIFRWIGIDLLTSQLGWPVWAAIAVTSIVYGLNHLFYGWPTVGQKMVTGAIYGTLYVVSGHAVLVPVIVHVVHNVVVLTIVPRLGGRV